MRIVRRLSPFDADILQRGVEIQRVNSSFTADARLFRAAEESSQVAEKPTIYPDQSGLYLPRDPMAPL